MVKQFLLLKRAPTITHERFRARWLGVEDARPASGKPAGRRCARNAIDQTPVLPFPHGVLDGVQELILERLTQAGFFKTKSEAIRAGVLELGKEYKLFKNFQEVQDELAVRRMVKLDAEVKSGKRKVLTEGEVRKKYGF